MPIDGDGGYVNRDRPRKLHIFVASKAPLWQTITDELPRFDEASPG